MTREETLARLRELQTRVQELRQAADNPALERTMQLLDLYCHMARWELGDVQGMNPEAETP
ncbi:MAG TPA: hypothetical protein VIF11_21730 [Methylomirabilota bacterium]